MKNILFTFCLLFVASVGFSQLKVIANGDVGIGTATPVQQLHVAGNAYLTGSLGIGGAASNPANIVDIVHNAGANDLLMRMWNKGTGGAKLRYVASNTAKSEVQLTTLSEWLASVNGTAAGGLNFNVRQTGSPNNEATLAASTVMTIDRDGEVGIGTTTPSALLHVNGTAIKPGGGSWGTVSDKRLKKDVKNFEDGLEQVLQIKPVYFKYNGEAGMPRDGKEYVGVLAQELREVAPYMIGEYNYHDYEADGLTDDDYQIRSVNDQSYLSVDDSAIKYMLINAIQEQQEIIESQSKEIEKLIQAVEVLNLKIVTNESTETIINTQVELTYYDLASLEQNIPNPFNGFTIIDYVIPTQANQARIDFYDMGGKLIKTQTIDHSGKGQVTVNANDIPSGNYSYRLIVDGKTVDSKKMVLTY